MGLPDMLPSGATTSHRGAPWQREVPEEKEREGRSNGVIFMWHSLIIVTIIVIIDNNNIIIIVIINMNNNDSNNDNHNNSTTNS